MWCSSCLIQLSKALNTWLKQFPQEGTSKTVVENIELLMLQFLDFSVRLLYLNKMPIEADKYRLGGLTK